MKTAMALLLSLVSFTSLAENTCPTTLVPTDDGKGYQTDLFQNESDTEGTIHINATFLYEDGLGIYLDRPTVFSTDSLNGDYTPSMFTYTYNPPLIVTGDEFTLDLYVDRDSVIPSYPNSKGVYITHLLNTQPSGQQLATTYPLQSVNIECTE